MKNIITVLVASMLVLTAQAEPTKIQKTVVCDTIGNLLTVIQTEFKERPVWVGKDESGSNFSVLANKETGSWTIIQFNATLGCVLGSGIVNSVIKE